MFKYIIRGNNYRALAVHSDLGLLAMQDYVRKYSRKLHEDSTARVFTWGSLDLVDPVVYTAGDFVDHLPALIMVDQPAKEPAAAQDLPIKVGTCVKTRKYLLANPIGSAGVCVQEYELDGRKGWMFLFENGEYDGFSPEEVKELLLVEETLPLDYKFTSVMHLHRDYRNGVFSKYLT
jgi:hypothetical protein